MVVARNPFKIPALARTSDPVHTERTYFAPGACFFTKSITTSGKTPGRVPSPVPKYVYQINIFTGNHDIDQTNLRGQG